jgi:hypothetical protein
MYSYVVPLFCQVIVIDIQEKFFYACTLNKGLTN